MNPQILMRSVYRQNIGLIQQNHDLAEKNKKLKDALKMIEKEIPKLKKQSKMQRKLDATTYERDELREEYQALQKQSEYERENYICTICYDNPREVLYFPCYHLAVCRTCNNNITECPICRSPVEHQIIPFT